MKGDCSICSAPPQVLRAVNDALTKREKLRDIAARSGFSKSALGRHSLRCVPRDALASHRNARFNFRRHRVFVKWPDGKLDLFSGPLDPDQHDASGDILLVISYEETANIKNPAALAHNGWNADAQRKFFDRVSPQVRTSFIESEHGRALLENSERGLVGLADTSTANPADLHATPTNGNGSGPPPGIA